MDLDSATTAAVDEIDRRASLVMYLNYLCEELEDSDAISMFAIFCRTVASAAYAVIRGAGSVGQGVK